ncbi:MAG: tRNA (adenosine(37)-N6)-threonylcarbamoyltransferase complex dimerization subunit type 1 TsaB [Pseudohongiellaceae bacterium]
MKLTTRLLAIDTLSRSCTVAVLDGNGDMHFRRGSGQRRHAREVLSLVDAVLHDSSLSLSALSAIAVISGPGSFTGLRIGMTVAQGLAYSTSLPVIPVSSLALLAEAASIDRANVRALCLLGARPGEYYHATYRVEDDLPRLLDSERVGPCTFADAEPHDLVVTDESTAMALRADPLFPFAEPTVVDVDAAVLVRLSARLMQNVPSIAISPTRAVPAYIKDDLEYRKSGLPGS